MGAPKYQIYDEMEVMISMLFKSFSTPARAKIMLILTSEGGIGMTQKELQQEIGLSQSTISEHLSVMKDSGVLETSLVFDRVEKKSCLMYKVSAMATQKFIEFGQHLKKVEHLMSHSDYEKLSAFFEMFSKRLERVSFIRFS
jgi:DNA-binding transcriptional ArsR family regulator